MFLRYIFLGKKFFSGRETMIFPIFL